MAYQLAFDSARRIARMTFQGRVIGAELTEAAGRLVACAGDGALDLVCDLREVSELALEADDLNKLLAAKLDGPAENADPRRDVILTRRPMDTLMANFYRVLAHRRGLPSLVCQTEEEARAWLGVTDLPEFAPT